MPRDKKYISVWLDPSFSAEVEKLSVRMGITKSELTRLALVQFVARETGGKTPRKERV